MISCAPSLSADRAAAPAPPVASVSRTIRATSLPPTSNSAIWAACNVAWPSAALLPESGSSRATRMAAPEVVGGGVLGSVLVGVGCALATGGGTFGPPPQAASVTAARPKESATPARRDHAVRRRIDDRVKGALQMAEENGPEPSRPPVRSKSSDDPVSRQPAEGLVIVATPVGNRHDITLRALALLASVDLVACEDTRVTGKLLALHGVRAALQAYHEHNAASVRPQLLARLAKGERIALVSDAGMPLISDPGYKLVREAIAAGIPVGVAPGASAVLAALVLSGLPSDRFFFGGFLPPREAARRSALAEFAPLRASLIFFEAPSRLAAP